MKDVAQIFVGVRWIFLPLAVYLFGAIFFGHAVPRWAKSFAIAIVGIVSATVMISMIAKTPIHASRVAPHGDRIVARTT